MNRSLFNLISRAGRASLDELLARNPTDAYVLARDIVAMIGEGMVAVSPSPDGLPERSLDEADLDPVGREMVQMLLHSEEGTQQEIVHGREGVLIDAFAAAIRNEDAGDAIMISPTSRGFKLIS